VIFEFAALIRAKKTAEQSAKTRALVTQRTRDRRNGSARLRRVRADAPGAKLGFNEP
jgi:hypothetical protein